MKSILLALAALAATVPAAAAAPDDLMPALHGYMAATKAPCYRRDIETRCSISGLVEGDMKVHRASGDVALAFVPYQWDNTGNGMDQMIIVLNRSGGHWAVVGRADNTVGTDPRDFRVAPGRITYVGTTMRPGDSRIAPTGKATFRLDVGPSGVTFVDPTRRATR